MRPLWFILIMLISGSSAAQHVGDEDIPLKEVNVNGAKIRYKVGTLGKSNLKHDGGFYMRNTEEVAIFLKEDNIPTNSFLDEVMIYITNEGIPTANFMVHVYAKDDTSNWPGKELTKKVAHAEKGNEWVKVNFADKRIQVKDVLIISVEWLAGNENDDTPWTIEKYGKYSTASAKPHNGAVLGATCDYGMMNLHFVTYAREPRQWYYASLPGKKVKRGMMRFDGQWNPMIYCTYTYRK